MATTQKDLTGKRFGRLIAIRNTGERAARKNGRKVGYIWECKCDCGNLVNIEIGRLTCGVTKSCGCLHSDITSKQMRKEDMSGKKFGKLTVIKWLPIEERKSEYKYYPYLCLCDCGNYTQAKRDDLIKGNKLSCGCLHEKYSHSEKRTALKHGESNTKLYKIWAMIKGRCFNKNNKNYKDYGGRGITICQEWLGEHGFENFRDWAMANGYDENAKHGECTIDRVDNDKGYSPDNCRWADMKVQSRNRRNNKKYIYNGEALTLREISEKTNVPVSALAYAISKNKDIELYINYYASKK